MKSNLFLFLLKYKFFAWVWVSEPYINKEINISNNIQVDLEIFIFYDMNVSTTIFLED